MPEASRSFDDAQITNISEFQDLLRDGKSTCEKALQFVDRQAISEVLDQVRGVYEQCERVLDRSIFAKGDEENTKGVESIKESIEIMDSHLVVLQRALEAMEDAIEEVEGLEIMLLEWNRMQQKRRRTGEAVDEQHDTKANLDSTEGN